MSAGMNPTPATDRHLDRLTRLQKMGEQAARVAHELKVPLSLIDGSLQNLDQYAVAVAQYLDQTATPSPDAVELAAQRVELDLSYLADQAPTLLSICREGTRRLRYLVQQLEDYARGTTPVDTRTLVDVSAVLREATHWVTYSRQPAPSIRHDLPVLPPVCADAYALTQVFVNLISNALDAVASSPEPSVRLRACVEDDAWVAVHVTDNGPGVPPELRARIFEAFFTTKDRPSGLGLGLAIVQRIVVQHGGSITVSTADGQTGADFIVRIPVAEVARCHEDDSHARADSRESTTPLTARQRLS